ncbi:MULTISPECIES: gluconokinase [unclassified Rhodococcus (in: high G+C Gram-positive bacteria)]|uniref:gluconokinase n=1 Tax=unclassified Rhodococcus (in: high G+C Gram-positive bacteria) TaxID=192944 RepID=UPI000927985B|nr:gluconokinase [Rhodococcus sp. M8]OLL16585.1 carbohydrate kinase [Rhodococcus sp. M8]QPG46656.1 gluconokinase [Rhodococcus sp. M8]
MDSPGHPGPPILVVMGVSGSGKSTVAALVAEATEWDLLEGDDLHPRANVEKMAAGRPLSDADRAPWLAAVGAWIRDHTGRGRPGVVTCSALRRRYRDDLAGENVVFVHLAGTREQIRERLRTRRGHYMPADLLDSQFDTFEPLEPDEAAIVVGIDAEPADVAAEIVARAAEWTRGTDVSPRP